MAERWKHGTLKHEFFIDEDPTSHDVWIVRRNLGGDPRDYHYTLRVDLGSATSAHLNVRVQGGVDKLGDFVPESGKTTAQMVVDRGEFSGLQCVFVGGAGDGILSGYARHRRLA